MKGTTDKRGNGGGFLMRTCCSIERRFNGSFRTMNNTFGLRSRNPAISLQTTLDVGVAALGQSVVNLDETLRSRPGRPPRAAVVNFSAGLQ
jgi:hypothetical protein